MQPLEGASHLRNTEPHYCAIKPMILAEELMGDGSVLPTDYKFHCIKGKVADVFVVCERESGAKYCTLDTNWQQLPLHQTRVYACKYSSQTGAFEGNGNSSREAFQ